VKVITRVFRVIVPAALHAEFEAKFLSVSVPDVQAAQGIVSVSVGRPSKWSLDEYGMISVWANEDALRSFAGESWNLAVIPAGMERYVSERWIHHYESFA
jgi:heme oxygenase (mycobilin-producing)